MYLAAILGEVETVKVLCECGADINKINKVSCYSPILLYINIVLTRVTKFVFVDIVVQFYKEIYLKF